MGAADDYLDGVIDRGCSDNWDGDVMKTVTAAAMCPTARCVLLVELSKPGDGTAVS